MVPLKSKSVRIWFGSLLVAFGLPVAGYLLGRATDCSRHEIDGQCGMSTWAGTLFGALAGAIVLVGMSLYMIMRRDD